MHPTTIGIIASGPSATEADARQLVAICDQVITVNDSWRLLPSADHLWATDYKWWRLHLGEVKRGFAGSCHTQDQGWPKCPAPVDWGIQCYHAAIDAPGLSRDPRVIHTGKNSGYAAIGLAYHLGAQRILLLGFDMQREGSRRNWFGQHPPGLDAGCDPSEFIQRFETIDPAEYGVDIWNCTRRTALECFPRVALEDIT